MKKMITKQLSHLYVEHIFGGKKIFSLCLMGSLVIMSGIRSVEADWIISPSIGIEQVYSDNAFLTYSDKESEYITVVRPTISLYNEGRRGRLDINYAPEYRYYREDTEDSDVVHFLRSEGSLEIAKNHLFLDGWLRGDRTDLINSGRTSVSGLTGTSDDTDYYSAGISPYFRSNLGDFVVTELRFAGDKIEYSEDVENDSKGMRGDLVFGSGSRFTNQVWEILFQQSEVDYENLDDDNETKIVRAELIQEITRSWSLAFSVGYEEYILAVADDRDDSTWSVGAIFSPNARFRVSLGVGERSFGDDYYFDLINQTSRTTWTARFTKEFVSARDEITTQPLFERQDAFGNLVRDPILESATGVARTTSSPTISEDYYELSRFATAFTYRLMRTALTLGAGYSGREYDDSVRDTQDTDLSLTLSRRLTRLLNGSIQIAGLYHRENLLDYDQWATSLNLAYQIGNQSSVALNITHFDRDAETEANAFEISYEENQASIGFVKQF
jgi:uncharacterized protein (PEP-CTERM system associated)